MRKHIILLHIMHFCMLNVVEAQNYLKNEWQFILGDKIEYKNNNIDISKWKSIESGKSWESQGYDQHDGFAWYIQDVLIPENIKKTAIKNGGFNLYLGTIDDADEVYINGNLIGKTGQFPPIYEGYFDKDRRYLISPENVEWGQINRIAVRVYDGGGDGGITGKNTFLKIIGEEPDIVVSAKFPTRDRIFLTNENTAVEIFIKNNSTANHKCNLAFSIINDFNDTIKTWSQIAMINKGKTFKSKLNLTLLPAGFYHISINSNNKAFSIEEKLFFGVKPEEIISPLEQPVDLVDFWSRAKKELAAVAPQYKLTKIDSLSTDKRDVYLVEMRSLENVLIRGWYGRPKLSGKYPAILHLQGYSSFQQMTRAYNGDSTAVFVLNIRGHGNSKDNVNPGFPGFLQYNLKDREKYIYRGAYMDCVRAIDFLYSRAEVDTSIIVVEGGSQGGALSIATAALDNERVKLCIAGVPFLSDFRDYFKIAYWPANEFTEFATQNHDFGWEKIYENLSYFDIKNLAPFVKCPVFMAVGLRDTTCPPHINFAAYNQINSRKDYVIYPENGHSLPAYNETVKYSWMKNEINKIKSQRK